jgi:hypothetical protein
MGVNTADGTNDYFHEKWISIQQNTSERMLFIYLFTVYLTTPLAIPWRQMDED